MAGERGRRTSTAPSAPLMPIERELFLRSMGGGPQQGTAAEQLARAMTDASFRAGEVIYRAGELARRMLFVTHGEVELTREDGEPWRLSAPSIIGVLDVNLRRPFART